MLAIMSVLNGFVGSLATALDTMFCVLMIIPLLAVHLEKMTAFFQVGNGEPPKNPTRVSFPVVLHSPAQER